MAGSMMHSVQWLLNKALTAAATLALAHWLAPAVYGAGMQALSIYQALALPLVLGLGDVLITRRSAFRTVTASANRAGAVAAAMSITMIVVAVPIVRALGGDPARESVGWLLLALAVRPLLEWGLMVPLAAMRLRMEYRRIAFVDGSVQACATLASVALAAAGAGAWAIIAPQLAAIAARSVWFRSLVETETGGRPRASARRLLLRRAFETASAQHVHSIINGLEVILLGWIASQAAAGFYAFALSLAAQANTVLAHQLGGVLQPVLGRLQSEPTRQVDGFLRAQRVLSSVAVPICVAQAIVAEPLFRMLFDARWQPAAPIFALLSLMLGFHANVGPSMACLRAQRRFRTLLAWQLTHLLVAGPVLYLTIISSGATGAALAALGLWGISAPIGMWLCTTRIEGRFSRCIVIPMRAWLIGIVVGLPGWLACAWIDDHGRIGEALAVLVIGPLTAIAGIALSARTDETVREALARAWDGLRRRMR